MYHPIIDRLKTIAELLPTAISGEFVPSGTKQISITENGTTTENVYSYANAEIAVNVQSGGIIPTGTKQISITQNGTTKEDVTNYASAEINVNVPTGGELPEGMNHTGSGEILFASRTSLNTPIYHGLDFIPKSIHIWTDENISNNNDMIMCVLYRELFTNPGQSKTQRELWDQNINSPYQIGHGIYVDNSADFFITEEYFNVGNGAKYYKPATTYYWFAFD